MNLSRKEVRHMQTWIDEQKMSSEIISAGSCRMDWTIFVSRSLTNEKVTQIKQHIANYLADLESAKKLNFSQTEEASAAPEIVQKICGELEVYSGMASDPVGYPPRITIDYWP